MSIIPGTTPTLTFQLDASILGCTAEEFCLVCGALQIVRTKQELAVSENGMEVSVRLSQSETLLLPDHQIAKVQLRVLLGGTVLATDVIPIATRELLHRKELCADGA